MAQRPIKEFRIGRVKALVWANETARGTMHNVTFQRLYKPEGEDWKTTDSFGRDDLPLVAKLADRVHTFIYEHNQRANGSPESAE